MSQIELFLIIFSMFPFGYGVILLIEELIRKTEVSQKSKDWMLFGGLFLAGALMAIAGQIFPPTPLETIRFAGEFFGLFLGGVNIAALIWGEVKTRRSQS